MVSIQPTPLGSIPVSGTPEDISTRWAWSVDMRRETGGSRYRDLPDESGWREPGTFTRPVFPTCPGHHPVGEIRIIIDDQEIALVGARTSRDVVELTDAEVRTMRKDPGFADRMRAWLAS